MYFKHFIASTLAIVMSISSIIPCQIVSVDSTAPETGVSMDDVQISATNSFSSMLAEGLSEVQKEQLNGNGNTIFSIEMSNNVASVDFQTVTDCTLVVGIYDESGETMLASGCTEVTPDDTNVQVDIVIDAMPTYYLVRGYLVDSYTLAPLSVVYDCPNYTKEMQEFLSKTVDDFDSDYVLNLDDQNDCNFAVYKEGTIIIKPTVGYNKVVSVDDANGVYVIENADSTVLSLKNGDVVSYEYSEDEMLIVNVDNVSIEGTTVTIKGKDAEMGEIFDYVRIEAEQGMNDAELTPSDSAEVLQQKSNYLSDGKKRAANTSGDISAKLNYKFKEKEKEGENGEIKISGNVSFEAKASVKVYISLSYSYFEWKVDYSVGVNVKIDGKIDMLSVPLGGAEFKPVKGLKISIQPKLVIRAEMKIKLDFTFKGTIGKRVSTEGNTDLTKAFRPSLSFKAEGRIFIGIDFSPEITFKPLTIKAEAEIGLEAVAEDKHSTDNLKSNPDEIHECLCCLDGDINFTASVSLKVEITKKWSLKAPKIEISFKLADFYYSIDNMEFGFGECPHQLYRVCVTVKDDLKKPVPNAALSFTPSDKLRVADGIISKSLSDTMYTKDDGKTYVYAPIGSLYVTAEKEDYFPSGKTTKLSQSASGKIQGNSVTITLKAKTQNPDEMQPSPIDENSKNEITPTAPLNPTTPKSNDRYKLIDDMGMTWTEAKEYCEELGGHLVTITSEEEEETIENLIASGSKNGYWLGGALDDKNNLSWVTGENVSYTKFAYGEPDNDYEQCLMIFKISNPWASRDTSLTWNDLENEGCSPWFSPENMGFVCEWEIDPSEYDDSINQLVIDQKIYRRVYNSPALASAEINAAIKETSFRELNPNVLYNFYVFRSDETEAKLNPTNLLYIAQFFPQNDGTATINYKTPFEDSNVVVHAIPYGSSTGDVNVDGVVDVLDIICMQKWLLSTPNSSLANWNAGDVYEDGIIDIFDLSLLKRMLIYGNV